MRIALYGFALALAAVVLAYASPASAQDQHIIARHSDKCFNVPRGDRADKTKIIQWDCGGGDNDRFRLKAAPGGYYSISPLHALDKCLDIDWNRRSSDGVQLELYRCHGGDNQLFQFRPVHGQHQIVAKVSGKCLDVWSHDRQAGAAIVQWGCKAAFDPGIGNQLFRLATVGSGSLSPASAQPGSRVTFSGMGAKPRTVMSTYFYCENSCGATHVGAAQVDEHGRWSLAFTVPPGARSGPAWVSAGCDKCGNGWTKFGGLTLTQPASQPPATPPPAARPTPVVGGVVTAAKPGPALVMVGTLANVTPLTVAEPLTNTSPLVFPGGLAGNAGSSLSLGGGNAFTMPIGNNFTMPIGNNLQSGRGRAVQAAVDPVIEIFRRAIGRAPSREEYQAWVASGHVLSDSGFREVLRRNETRPLREAVVTTAFAKVVRRAPRQDELQRWQGWVAQGKLYTEVVSQLQRR